MQIKNSIDIRTSGQVDPKYKNANAKQVASIPLVINGCVVSLASTAKSTDDTIKAVKEILLSAYRTRTANR